MLKFLLIVGIIGYLLYKIGSFFFKVGAASQHMRQQQTRQDQAKKAQSGKIKGGDYVDYEEVK